MPLPGNENLAVPESNNGEVWVRNFVSKFIAEPFPASEVKETSWEQQKFLVLYEKAGNPLIKSLINSIGSRGGVGKAVSFELAI